MVPAVLLHPFLILLQTDVSQAPADTTRPFAPVAGPLVKEEQGYTPTASQQDHKVPALTSSRCCSSTFHHIPLPALRWLPQAEHYCGDGTSHLLVALWLKAGPHPFLSNPSPSAEPQSPVGTAVVPLQSDRAGGYPSCTLVPPGRAVAVAPGRCGSGVAGSSDRPLHPRGTPGPAGSGRWPCAVPSASGHPAPPHPLPGWLIWVSSSGPR